MATTRVQRIMTQPINLIFRFLQSKARIQIWLFKQKDLRIEGRIIADRVSEGRRASAFGILTGISAAGFVSGTIAARFLPTSYIFQIPIDCFEETWVIFRGKDGKPGCLQNTCAHRACPLHLGSVNEGRIQCAYHGWEYSTDGKCEKMPSTRMLNVRIRSLPCSEEDGMVWIWPGDAPPTATLPSLQPPSGFKIHAEIVMELPVEHGLLLDNLLDHAHAPFTHTSTFAKGWSVPRSNFFV